VATRILQNWDEELPRFVKVMPTDYKRALSEQKKELAKA
jgi:glutamate synthase domain-containing protein 3